MLDEKAEHQILLISLPPAGIVYLKAPRLFASADIKTAPATPLGWFSALLGSQTLVAVNDTSTLQVMGVKHPIKQGRLLILDLGTYRDSFYFSEESLVASRKAPSNRLRHPLLPMVLAEHLERPRNILDAL